jgi:hypothetical protein
MTIRRLCTALRVSGKTELLLVILFGAGFAALPVLALLPSLWGFTVAWAVTYLADEALHVKAPGFVRRPATLQLSRTMRFAVRTVMLLALADRTTVLDGIGERAFVDIDSLLRPVYGHAKQGASFGHTKIAGKQVLRKGLSPLATTISTEHSAPVIAGMRLRAGKTGSGKGAGRMLAQAIGQRVCGRGPGAR